MLNKMSTFIEYIKWLYKYTELQKSSGNIFRVISSEVDKNGEYVIDVQVINKSSIFRCNVSEIVSQDQLLENFSKSDIKLITYLATKDMLKPKNKIIGYEFNIQDEKTLLQIKKFGSDTLIKLSADEISNNSDLLKSFSQEDAHKTGYLMAMEQTILEKKVIERYK